MEGEIAPHCPPPFYPLLAKNHSRIVVGIMHEGTRKVVLPVLDDLRDRWESDAWGDGFTLDLSRAD